MFVYTIYSFPISHLLQTSTENSVQLVCTILRHSSENVCDMQKGLFKHNNKNNVFSPSPVVIFTQQKSTGVSSGDAGHKDICLLYNRTGLERPLRVVLKVPETMSLARIMTCSLKLNHRPYCLHLKLFPSCINAWKMVCTYPQLRGQQTPHPLTSRSLKTRGDLIWE